MNYKKQREKRNLTQSEVAIKVGLSLQGYQLIERGVTQNPRPKTLNKIEKILSGPIKTPAVLYWGCKYCGENEHPKCHKCVREDGRCVSDEINHIKNYNGNAGRPE